MKEYGSIDELHEDLVTLTQWMARHNFSADDLALAVAKPWNYGRYLARPRRPGPRRMREAPLPSRHFHVPAREMLLDTSEPCPAYPLLVLEGLAVTPSGQHHLVLTLRPTARAYFGPDRATVERRAQVLVAGLSARTLRTRPEVAQSIGEWVILAWDAMLDELVDAIAGDAFSGYP